MQVDREILSVLNQLIKIVYDYNAVEFSSKGVSNFLNLNEGELETQVRNHKLLGFRVLKNWDASEDNLHELLKNNFVIARADNDKIISMIRVIKVIRNIEQIQRMDDLYVEIEGGEADKEYEIVHGVDLNEENTEYPNRYLLLRKLEGDKSVVQDFGDFPKYKVKNMLKYFVLNEKYFEIYPEIIYDLMREINIWLDLTGGEFLIDTKMFRLGIRPASNKG